MRERESLFNEFIVDVRRREKDDKQQKKEQVCRDRPAPSTPRPFVLVLLEQLDHF